VSLVWVALVALLVLTLGGIAFTAVHGVKMVRAMKRLSRSAKGELEKLSVSSEQMNRKLEQTTASLARLDARLAHFNVTRARARVLSSALAEVQETLNRARAIIPSK